VSQVKCESEVVPVHVLKVFVVVEVQLHSFLIWATNLGPQIYIIWYILLNVILLSPGGSSAEQYSTVQYSTVQYS